MYHCMIPFGISETDTVHVYTCNLDMELKAKSLMLFQSIVIG